MPGEMKIPSRPEHFDQQAEFDLVVLVGNFVLVERVDLHLLLGRDVHIVREFRLRGCA